MWDPDGRCPDYLKSVNGGAAWEQCRGFQDELGRQGSLRLKGVELLRNYVSDWYEQWESIGTKPKPASRSNWRRFTDFVGGGAKQVGGVFKGVAEGGVDFLVGTGTIVKDGVTGIAALGAYYGYERWAGGDEPGWGARTIMGLDTKYDAVWDAVKSDWVNALFGTERIKAEWAEGNYGEALGHGLFTALLYTAPIKPIAAKPHVTTNIASRLTNYTVTRTSPSLFPVTRGIESRLANYTVTAAEAAIRPGATAVTAANNLSRVTAAAEVSAAGSSRALGGVGAPPSGVEGSYVVTTGTGEKYVGQSMHIDIRMGQHVSARKFSAADVMEIWWQEVTGGKLAREIAEQLKIDELRRARIGLINKVNPIGERRTHLMPNQPYVR